MTTGSPGFYAYTPTQDGQEPTGTSERCIRWDLTTVRGAVRWSLRRFGRTVRLFRFTNFYDDSTFREIAVRSDQCRR